MTKGSTKDIAAEEKQASLKFNCTQMVAIIIWAVSSL